MTTACSGDGLAMSLVQQTADSFPIRLDAATLERARWDVPFFSKAYLGIRLHPGQVEFADAYLKRTSSGWRAQYLNITVSAGNRAGKTMCLAVIILHSCLFRMGLQPPDGDDIQALEHWRDMPYHWWHFAIEQAPAEQVFAEIATLMGGTHPAQRRGNPWVKQIMEGAGIERDKAIQTIMTLTDTGIGSWCQGPKERGEYAWIKFARDFGGAEVHFRSTKAKALSAIGQNMHGLSFDEAGLETQLTYLLEEVFHARRLTTGGQFIVISTPSVATSTEFIDLWYTGDPDDVFRNPRRISLRMSSRLNIGFGMDQETFDALIFNQPEKWISQNIDGKFEQADNVYFNKASVDDIMRKGLPAEQEPVEGHLYLHSLDPGLKDKCWSLVFAVLPGRRVRGVHIERQVGKQTTPGIVALGGRNHRRYSMWQKDEMTTGEPITEAHCVTGVDTTALGGHMFRDLILAEPGVPAIVSVEFGGNGKVKRDLLSDLKTLIDEGRIEMPDTDEWQPAKRQLIAYKLLDRKIEQDLVMGLAIIAKLLRTAPAQTQPLKETAFEYGVAAEEQTYDDGINSKNIRRKMRERRLARAAAVADAMETE